MAELRDRTVLLTGASSGLGPYIARRLRAEGARLVLTARRRPELEALAAELGDTRVIPADLAEAGEAERLVEAAGPVDVLVANAGVGIYGRLSELDPAGIGRSLDVNLRAPMLLSRLVLPAMLERGSGAIVLMASLAGKVPAPRSTLYSATKFGLRGFGHSLAAELRGTGVTASVISPTFVEEAGLYADSGGRAGVRTVYPNDVAEAVVKGIRTGRAEIVVAPVEQRILGRLVEAVPELIHTVARGAGAMPRPDQR